MIEKEEKLVFGRSAALPLKHNGRKRERERERERERGEREREREENGSHAILSHSTFYGYTRERERCNNKSRI